MEACGRQDRFGERERSCEWLEISGGRVGGIVGRHRGKTVQVSIKHCFRYRNAPMASNTLSKQD
jgi:hypothetical protein